MSDLQNTVTIDSKGGALVSKDVLDNEKHALRINVDRDNGDVYLEFSTRQALYDFAKSLLHEAVYGQGEQKEFYPLIFEGKSLVVDGVRLTADSSRLFLNVSESEPHKPTEVNRTSQPK